MQKTNWNRECCRVTRVQCLKMNTRIETSTNQSGSAIEPVRIGGPVRLSNEPVRVVTNLFPSCLLSEWARLRMKEKMRRPCVKWQFVWFCSMKRRERGWWWDALWQTQLKLTNDSWRCLNSGRLWDLRLRYISQNSRDDLIEKKKKRQITVLL